MVPASSGSAVPYHFVASLVEPFFIQSHTDSWDANLRKILQFNGGMMSAHVTSVYLGPLTLGLGSWMVPVVHAKTLRCALDVESSND